VVNILLGLLIISFAVRVLGQFRSLIFPLFRRKSGGKLRRLLRIHSYLPRWVSASAFLGAWLLGIIGAWLLLEGVSHIGSGWLPTLLSGYVVVVVSLYIGVAWFYYRRICTAEQKRIQRKRDGRARAALAQLTSTGEVPFSYSVWLRPFYSTGRVWVVEKSRPVKFKGEDISKAGYHVEWGDFETFLAIAIESFAPLIALGVGGEQIGAGRIDIAEDDWQNTFKLLAGSAHSVFFLPFHRSGTQWELHWLLETPRVLQRCIFVVPPLPDLDLRTRAGFAAPGVKDLPSNELGPFSGIDQSDIALRRQQQLWDVRSEVMDTLAQLLVSEDYAKLEKARHGALFQLTGESGPHIVRYSKLEVSAPWWNYWSGPRFSQPQLRSTVLDLIDLINN
jgi:hypothetical protein